ncbi:hypothetical protein HGP28_17135 [Vibrio sp. SM6]|uniref:BIG2 domain-containing protein n=1 Tax=Vibrio agarilyticus TaxID=2726741 RepID=A0A7X8TTG3_9VIBR|nr:hypothetical protein [Vibrio agarilyticus]NLS14585.1 hypothetical protein [Vibrio agarilyticus]
MKRKTWGFVSFFTLVLLLTTGCDDPHHDITNIEIVHFDDIKDGTPNSAETAPKHRLSQYRSLAPFALTKGAQRQLALIGYDSAGNRHALVKNITWHSGFGSIINIDSQGRVTAKKAYGASAITAQWGSLYSPPLAVFAEPAKLMRLEILSDKPDIPLGGKQALKLIGYYSDNTSRIITEQARWGSTTPNMLHVSPKGVVNAKQLTSAAHVQAHYQNVKTEIRLRIVDSQLIDLIITPNQVTLPQGSNYPISVQAKYSDGTVIDVSNRVTWRNARPSRVHIDDKNQIIGLRPSNAVTIEALYQPSLGDDTSVNTEDKWGSNIPIYHAAVKVTVVPK